jgi:transcriptional regulator with XRE-family HTH domain
MTNLALLRARRGWTQGELAKRAGLSVRHVRYLEAGRKTPRLTTVVRLAQALGVRDTDLIRAFTEGQARKPASSKEVKSRRRR